MGKLNQVIAVVAGKKKLALEAITGGYHKIQKPELFSGISRAYQPRDEEGESLPSERKSPQAKVQDLISDIYEPLTEMLDTVFTQDYANQRALSNIFVAPIHIASNVPVTYLLFLEKHLADLTTFISKLPILDPAETWTYSDTTDSYVSDATETVRTKKIPRAFVKAEATKEHAAQVDTFTEDIIVGNWRTTKFSGAISASDKAGMLTRIRLLAEEVRKAREEANSIEVEEKHIGKSILDYVFDK